MAGTLLIILEATYTDRDGLNHYTQTWPQEIPVAQRDQPAMIVEKMFTAEARIIEVKGDVGVMKNEPGSAGGHNELHIGGDAGSIINRGNNPS